MRRVYLDHAATTPVRPEVAELALKFMTEMYGNASSIHVFGREARRAVEEAREQVARLIGAQPQEIVFTGGGTEADNLAILGVAQAMQDKGRHIVTSAIEHHAVGHTCEALVQEGWEVTRVGVDPDGLVDPQQVARALRPDTVLVTIMHSNNEVGTLQPIAEIGRLTRSKGIYLHTDAVQSIGKVPIDVEAEGIDLLTLSGHKLYAPKGTGALYVRKGVKLKPIVHGGGHERRKRPGTENVPGIAGLGLACELAREELGAEPARLAGLRDTLIAGIMGRIDRVKLNGHPVRRLPHNANLSFAYVEGEAMLLNLDLQGIAASSGSACTSGSLEPSHVLLAMGISHEVAHGSLRLTLGRANTMADVDYVLEVLPGIIRRLRDMSPLAQHALASEKEATGACTTRK